MEQIKKKKEKKQNNVIHKFLEEYKQEYSEFGGTNLIIENTKRKKSPKLQQRKLDLEALYEETQSESGLKLDKNRKRLFNIVPGGKSQLITMFRKPPSRLRRTNISASQIQLLMRKPLKKAEEKIMNDIVKEKKVKIVKVKIMIQNRKNQKNLILQALI